MKRSIKYCIYILLILGTCLAQPVYAAVAKNTGGAVLHKKETTPHKELKLTDGHVQVIAIQSVHKTGGHGVFNSTSYVKGNDTVIASTIEPYPADLIKDYLFFIYPSHHFW